MKLRSGDRIPKAEIASRFGVLQQPVRGVFTRLVNLDLLLIRPQRTTEVKRFSMREIKKALFDRTAIVLEAQYMATNLYHVIGTTKLNTELEKQELGAKNLNTDLFSRLNYEFHKVICEITRVDIRPQGHSIRSCE